MKQRLNLLLALFFLISTAFAKAPKASFLLKNSDGVKTIQLNKVVGDISSPYDTLKVKKGKFTIIQEEDFNQGVYELLLTEQNRIALVLADETFSAELDASDLAKEPSFKNSENNTFYQAYVAEIVKFGSGIRELENQFSLMKKQFANNSEAFNEGLAGLRIKVDELRENRDAFFSQNLESSSEFVSSVSEIMMTDDTLPKENYLNKKYFTDMLATGNFLVQRIQNYGIEKVRLTQENVAVEMTNVLTYAPKKSLAREVAYMTIIRLTINVNVSLAKQFFTAYKWEYPRSSYLEIVDSMFPKEPVAAGDEAPEIEMTDMDGNTRKLSDLRGKVVLIDFWASWCRPCRMENPNVVRLYNEYKEKGFEVFSVSLDRNKESWKRAVEKDGLVWSNHVSELKHWDCQAARDYSVTGIPATFLIDKDGKIIQKNLRGQSLEIALSNIFNE